MEYEAKDPTGYFSTLCLEEFFLSGLDGASCKGDIFLTGWAIVVPLDVPMAVKLLGEWMDLGHYVTEWKTCEI